MPTGRPQVSHAPGRLRCFHPSGVQVAHATVSALPNRETLRTHQTGSVAASARPHRPHVAAVRFASRARCCAALNAALP